MARSRIGGRRGVWLGNIALRVQGGKFGESVHTLVEHRTGLHFCEARFVISFDGGGKGGEEPCGVLRLAERTFGIFRSRMDGLRGLECF